MTSDRDLRRRYALLHDWAQRQVPAAAPEPRPTRAPAPSPALMLAAAAAVVVLGAVALWVPRPGGPQVQVQSAASSQGATPQGPVATSPTTRPAGPSSVTTPPSVAPSVPVGGGPSSGPRRSPDRAPGRFRGTVDRFVVDGRTVRVQVSATGERARRRLTASCLEVALAGDRVLRRRAVADLADSASGVAGTLTFDDLLPGPATLTFGCAPSLGTTGVGTVGRPGPGTSWWVSGGESTRPEGVGGTATVTRVTPGPASVTVGFDVVGAPDIPAPATACLVVRGADGTTLTVAPAATTVTEDGVLGYTGTWTFAVTTTPADLFVSYACDQGWSQAPLGAVG